jgi:hypothetical protein|tara:strand:+ start:263 stop:718 length:456 start_codon:yes stop_codon:yes gene_type:complete
MIERLTLEETENYFNIDEDFTDAPIKFYSVEPDKDGWEKVNYYTARKKDIYRNRGKADQWVYILSSFNNDYYKIGYTKNEPELRAKQISASTGVAHPYKVEFAFQCFNGEALEHEVHRKLKHYRVNSNREFFDVTLHEAIDVIVDLGKNYK